MPCSDAKFCKIIGLCTFSERAMLRYYFYDTWHDTISDTYSGTCIIQLF